MARGKALEDLTGRKIHRLTFLEYVGREEGSNSRWKVRCECGKEFIVYACNVKAGRTTSCGCYLKEIIQKRFKKTDMSINNVTLLGRVGRNPEIKDINGVKCATFSLATGEKYKDRNGNLQEKTQWHNIVAWRATADVCGKYVKQGDQICVLGKIEYRTWENDKGEKRYSTDIVADRVELLGSRSASQADDDLPE